MSEKIVLYFFSYLVGSIPFALILVKIFYQKNLLIEGSGNIGARNAYDVTNNPFLGIVIFLLDFFKGFLTIYAVNYLLPNDFVTVLLCGLFVVLGHNFSIYLKFKGGRGLATSAGILLEILPIILPLWCFFWLIVYKLSEKNVHISNFFATIISPFVFYFIPFEAINSFALIRIDSKILLFIFLSLLSFLVIIKHIQPLSQLMRKN